MKVKNCFLALCVSLGVLVNSGGLVSAEELQQQTELFSIQTPELYTAFPQLELESLYRYVSEGNTLGKGCEAEYGKSMQSLLNLLGRDIQVDGAVGSKTIEALNRVQYAIGVPETEAMDITTLDALLACAVCLEEESIARQYFPSDNDYYYYKGCGLLAQGCGYQALDELKKSTRVGTMERQAKCEMEKPQNGQVYRNPDYPNGGTRLNICVESCATAQSAYFKLYLESGELVAGLFLHETGTVSADLPAADYIIKMGTGYKWYGEVDSFGKDPGSYYEVMTFDSAGTQVVTLDYGYEFTLTINTATVDSGASSVGAQNQNWEEF